MTVADRPRRRGEVPCEAAGVFLVSISLILYSGGMMCPSAVITVPRCDAAEAGSENPRLYPQFPWGPGKPSLLNFFPASLPLLP